MITLHSHVQWRSQGSGVWKVKEGEIVEIIPVGQTPDGNKYPTLRAGGIGMPRNHESYVVAVGKRHYWPRVSALC